MFRVFFFFFLFATSHPLEINDIEKKTLCCSFWPSLVASCCRLTPYNLSSSSSPLDHTLKYKSGPPPVPSPPPLAIPVMISCCLSLAQSDILVPVFIQRSTKLYFKVACGRLAQFSQAVETQRRECLNAMKSLLFPKRKNGVKKQTNKRKTKEKKREEKRKTCFGMLDWQHVLMWAASRSVCERQQ